MTDNDKPKLLSIGMVNECLKNSAFYKAVPEFIPLRTKYNDVNKQLNLHGGCSSCRKRRIAANVFREFSNVVGALNGDAKARLRGYLGCSVMIQRQSPKTKKIITITI